MNKFIIVALLATLLAGCDMTLRAYRSMIRKVD